MATRVQIDDLYAPEVIDRGEGAPAILIHGTPLDAHCWDRLDLPDWRLIAYDLRGHGSAKAVVPASSYEELANDLATLLDRLSLPRARIVGHSFGGQVAQVFAAGYPERTEALSIVCSRCEPFAPFSELAERIEADGLDAIATETLERWFGGDAVARETDGVRYARGCLERADPAASAAAFRLIAPFTLPAELRFATFPIGFIAAERDPIASSEVLSRGAEAVGGSFLEASGVGHMLPVENPRLLERLLEDPE